jgi:hypothetical protein
MERKGLVEEVEMRQEKDGALRARLYRYRDFYFLG